MEDEQTMTGGAAVEDERTTAGGAAVEDERTAAAGGMTVDSRALAWNGAQRSAGGTADGRAPSCGGATALDDMLASDGAPARAEPAAGGGDGLRAPIEAVMMVAAEPVPASDIADALGVDQEEADGALRALARSYREEGRGFELREAAGGWRVYSSPRFADVVGRFVVGTAQARLSQAALETLAIIAYRQPVTRARVSRVRGVGVDAVVRTLMARGLIAEVGETESGARLYGTTSEFLEKMGLGSLEDLVPLAPYLPAAEELDDLEDQL